MGEAQGVVSLVKNVLLKQGTLVYNFQDQNLGREVRGWPFSLRVTSCAPTTKSKQPSIGVIGNDADRLIKLVHIYKQSIPKL